MITIQNILERISKEQAKHIEEFACVYFKKTKADPRKVVMIQHFDFTNGNYYYWFEKKRGRSRKEIIGNARNSRNLLSKE